MSTQKKKTGGISSGHTDSGQSLLGAAPEKKLIETHEPSLLEAHDEAKGAAAAAAVGAAGIAAAASKAAASTPPEATVVDQAPVEPMAPPVPPKSNSWQKNTVIAVLIGALVMIGLICCLGYLNDRNDEPYYTNAAFRDAQAADKTGAMAATSADQSNGHYYLSAPAAGKGSMQGAKSAAGIAAAGNAQSAVAVPVVVYLFNFDSDGVPENPTLTSMAKAAKESGKTIYVRAYTDERGNQGYNQKLSQRRANAIGDYMEQHGVPAAHVKAAGCGPTHKYASDMQNRRAELTLK